MPCCNSWLLRSKKYRLCFKHLSVFLFWARWSIKYSKLNLIFNFFSRFFLIWVWCFQLISKYKRKCLDTCFLNRIKVNWQASRRKSLSVQNSRLVVGISWTGSILWSSMFVCHCWNIQYRNETISNTLAERLT